MPFPDLTDQEGFVLNNQLDALIIQEEVCSILTVLGSGHQKPA